MFQEGENSAENDNWHYSQNAALYAEFGKIVCISLATMKESKFYVKAITGRHEQTLLASFTDKILPAARICGHNLKEFDAPYITRRLWANGLPIPTILNMIGKKPWELPMLDTLEMWGGTQFKYRCGLDLLCSVLGIESPKQEITGADVGRIYWGMFDGLPEDQLPFEKEQETLGRIGNYCNADVIATAQAYCRMMGLSLIKQEQIVYL